MAGLSPEVAKKNKVFELVQSFRTSGGFALHCMIGAVCCLALLGGALELQWSTKRLSKQREHPSMDAGKVIQ